MHAAKSCAKRVWRWHVQHFLFGGAVVCNGLHLVVFVRGGRLPYICHQLRMNLLRNLSGLPPRKPFQRLSRNSTGTPPRSSDRDCFRQPFQEPFQGPAASQSILLQPMVILWRNACCLFVVIKYGFCESGSKHSAPSRGFSGTVSESFQKPLDKRFEASRSLGNGQNNKTFRDTTSPFRKPQEHLKGSIPAETPEQQF